MAISWDWIISAGILIGLGLIIASRVTNQKVPELLAGIKDFIAGTKDDALERGEELLYYD